MTDDDFATMFHEAAFEPERWPGVLSCLAGRTAARWAALIISFDIEPVILTSEAAFDPSGCRTFQIAAACRHDIRAHRRMTARQARGSASVVHSRPISLIAIGGAEADRPAHVALVPVVRGVTLAAGFEPERDDGSDPRATDERLASVLPCLAHAVAGAIRVGVEKARSAVDAMAVMGRAAVAVDRRGRSVAVNDIFGRMPLTGRLGSDGRVTFGKPQADKQVLEALDRIATSIRHGAAPGTLRPILVTKQGEIPACFATLYPLVRSTRDPFASAVALIVEEPIQPRAAADPDTLSACFGLTSAEARTASAAGTGMAIDDIAALTRTGRETVRTHLKRVLAKTGTVRQAELVALLAPFIGTTVPDPLSEKAGMDLDFGPSKRRRSVGVGRSGDALLASDGGPIR
jgi:DNA-binding CsgD family transcriptional regulator